MCAGKRQATLQIADSVGGRRMAKRSRRGANPIEETLPNGLLVMEPEKHSRRKGISRSNRAHDFFLRHRDRRLPNRLAISRSGKDAFGSMKENRVVHAGLQ